MSGINNYHDALPDGVWFVRCVGDMSVFYYGPYKRPQAKAQATRMTKKGFATVLLPYHGPDHELAVKYPPEE